MATTEPINDIAAVLDVLRAEVKARRQQAPGAERSALEQQLDRCIEQLEITRVVSAHWPLEGSNPLERAWVLLHKVVRRYLRWYINPIVDQQNAFNDTAARALRLLAEGYGDLRQQIEQKYDASDAGPPNGAIAANQATHERAELDRLHEQLSQQQAVSAHFALGGHGARGLASAVAKRSIRQYLRWMINPIVEQQNAFNAALATALPIVAALDAELRARSSLKRPAR